MTMISVFSDGASSSRGGLPGGYGWVVVKDGNEVIAADWGWSISTTNNVMELTGAIEGLKYVLEHGLYEAAVVELVSDSQYVLGCGSGAFNPTTNFELIVRLKELIKDLRARTRWVRGHNGNRWNERCDSLAGKGKAYAKQKALEE